jgi:hypothetical protein
MQVTELLKVKFGDATSADQICQNQASSRKIEARYHIMALDETILPHLAFNYKESYDTNIDYFWPARCRP